MLEDVTVFIGNVVAYAVPYILCSLGIMTGGLVGIFNITGEGLMMLGASTAFLGAFFVNMEIGLLLAVAVAFFCTLMLVFFTERYKISQFILGIAIFILTFGIASFVYKIAIGVRPFQPTIDTLGKIEIPGLSQLPLISGFFNQNIFVYFTYGVVLILYLFFFRTKMGLGMRAIGEDPKAADATGINVFRARYALPLIGGILMGLAGAYLSLSLFGFFSRDMVSGRGFMAIGLTVFGSWRPQRIFLGSFLFAGMEVLAYTVYTLYPSMPYQFIFMIPFVVVLLVLSIFYKYIKYPKAIGKTYSRE